MKKYPHLARIAMFMELARGTGANLEKAPRDARLPKVCQPTGGKEWWVRIKGHEPLNPPASFAFWIAVQTATGVAGIVMWRIWNSLCALTIALITAAGAGVVPPSPPALMP